MRIDRFHTVSLISFDDVYFQVDDDADVVLSIASVALEFYEDVVVPATFYKKSKVWMNTVGILLSP